MKAVEYVLQQIALNSEKANNYAEEIFDLERNHLKDIRGAQVCKKQAEILMIQHNAKTIAFREMLNFLTKKG